MTAKTREVRRPERAENRVDSASGCLQEYRDEEMEISEGAEYRNYQNGRCSSSLLAVIYRVCIAILFLVALVFFFLYITSFSAVKESQQQRSEMADLTPCKPPCPSGWIGYEGKCYFFSNEGRNWTSGQSFCTSFNSSLAVIENEPEKAFIMRYECSTDHWIGLRKDPDHSWKWADGTELNGMLEVKGEGGDCAFLNSGFAVSSRCYIQRNWICSHHDAYAHNKSSFIKR